MQIVVGAYLRDAPFAKKVQPILCKRGMLLEGRASEMHAYYGLQKSVGDFLRGASKPFPTSPIREEKCICAY